MITAGLAQRFTTDPNAAPATASAATPATTPATASATAPATTPAAASTPAPAATVTATPSAGGAETLTISKEALTKLQQRIAGLENELTNVRTHMTDLLSPPNDTPAKSQE